MSERDVLHSPETIEATKQGIEDWRAGRVRPMMQAQTDLTARTFRSALVGWCLEPECRVYMEPYTRGEECPMMCERPAARIYDQFYRTLAKRRVLICEYTDGYGDTCAMCFATQEGADEHDCYSAY